MAFRDLTYTFDYIAIYNNILNESRYEVKKPYSTWGFQNLSGYMDNMRLLCDYVGRALKLPLFDGFYNSYDFYTTFKIYTERVKGYNIYESLISEFDPTSVKYGDIFILSTDEVFDTVDNTKYFAGLVLKDYSDNSLKFCFYNNDGFQVADDFADIDLTRAVGAYTNIAVFRIDNKTDSDYSGDKTINN